MTLTQLPCLNVMENYILIPSLSTYQTNKFSIPVLALQYHFRSLGVSVPEVNAIWYDHLKQASLSPPFLFSPIALAKHLPQLSPLPLANSTTKSPSKACYHGLCTVPCLS